MLAELPTSSPHTRRLRVADAAAYAGCSASFLNKARLTGDGPVFLKLGKSVIYDISDLDAWLNCRRRRSTSDLGVVAA